MQNSSRTVNHPPDNFIRKYGMFWRTSVNRKGLVVQQFHTLWTFGVGTLHSTLVDTILVGLGDVY